MKSKLYKLVPFLALVVILGLFQTHNIYAADAESLSINNYVDNPSGSFSSMTKNTPLVKNFTTNIFDMSKYKSITWSECIGQSVTSTYSANITVSLYKEDGTFVVASNSNGWGGANNNISRSINISNYTGNGFLKINTTAYWVDDYFVYANITDGKISLIPSDSPQISSTNLTRVN